ncbi:hypothetical protein GQ43DRAFT_455625 [Delitschia confertaspora ATCC 74209]|uniref:M protein repeat protein n=1 Tax=Delitschia confertaspora ATCC 74209 TaxID=1513339 RepID=A0A9P4JSB0_9PLEO|nr:hypothetical protein GQ43DRAFT_455625 [Delitschia confertaspora ATCC 74209]
MAETDEEKAAKVAAAKKRYEQLKKQKAKKGKKKEEKPETIEAEPSTSTDKTEEKLEENAEERTEQTPLETFTETAEPAPAEPEESEEPSELPNSTTPSHGRKPSIAVESRLRSASFYRGDAGITPTSPTQGGDAVGDIYRKQAQRIEELEKENRRLTGEAEGAQERWKKMEEELEELRAGRGDAALAAERGVEVEKLKAEVTSLQRQLSHLQTQTSPLPSASVDDLNAQVASKSATIESLELEISNLHKQLTEQTNTTSDLQGQITVLQSSLEKAEQAADASKTELLDLKANLEKASEEALKEGSSRNSAETRIAQLEAELGAATRKASDEVSRADLLEKKVETLTTLHRENDARNQTRQREHQKVEREVAELRTRITGLSNENARLREAEQRRRKAEISSIDDSGVDELVDESRERLMARIRELEEESSELRRGIWRDRRKEMQPPIDAGHEARLYSSSGFQDVDLSGGHQQPRSPAAGRIGSSFQDVINSGISAFTRQTHHRGQSMAHGRDRQQSLSSLDDFEFDEDAFRLAQEEEQRKRLERVREVKRGLKNWEGWRADFVDVRAGWGGVFEV